MGDLPSASQHNSLIRETQSFVQPWLWVLIIVAAGFAWFTFLFELFGSLSEGEGSGQVWLAALIWALVGLGLPALFLTTRLIVEVRPDGLYYRFSPFHRRVHHIGLGEIKKAEARTYNPIREYGGWGIRGGWKKGIGKAYNVYGNRGLQLELTNGKKILFGSQKADELAAALNGLLAEGKHSRDA
jgi:hypothetical protein